MSQFTAKWKQLLRQVWHLVVNLWVHRSSPVFSSDSSFYTSPTLMYTYRHYRHYLTHSICQDPVILRSCCQTWTFILRFRSLGNILCKLSTSFALEHFLRLLPFLWQYHMVKVKTLINYRLTFYPQWEQGWIGKTHNPPGLHWMLIPGWKRCWHSCNASS